MSKAHCGCTSFNKCVSPYTAGDMWSVSPTIWLPSMGESTNSNSSVVHVDELCFGWVRLGLMLKSGNIEKSGREFGFSFVTALQQIYSANKFA